MRTLLASAVAVLLLAAPAGAADDKITFDTSPAVAGQSADSIYQTTPGFIFGGGVENPPGGEFPSYQTCGTTVTALATAPSQPNVAMLGCGGSTEFPNPPVLFAKATRTTRSNVSVKVGDSKNGNHTMRLSAYDGQGKLLNRSASAPITASGTTLTVSAGQPEITYFTVEETGTSSARGVWIDDVTADIPPIPGKPSFGIFRTAGAGTVTVRQGETVSIDLTLYRINGSTGEPSFATTDVPTGMTAGFSSSVNGRTLTLKAGIGATPTALNEDKILNVIATPSSSATGTTAARIAIPIRIAPAIEVITTPKSSPLPSCGGIDVVYAVAPDAGPAFFSMPGLPDGVTATINGKEISAADKVENRGTVKLDFVLTKDVPADATGTLTLTGPQGTDPISGRPVNFAGSAPIAFRALKPLTDLTPLAGQTPRELKPGTLVKVKGEPGCIGPNLRLRFGNDKALAPIISNDGGVYSANVPRLATPGPVQLVSLKPDGTLNAGRANGPVMQIDNYRNTVGFDFHNYKPSLTIDQMVRAFGRDEVYITPNVCGAATLGLFDCKVGTPIPDPWAMIVLEIANRTMGGSSGGACFGISVTSQQLRRNPKLLAGLGAKGATTGFSLGSFGTDMPPGGLNELINANHLSQLSSQYLDYYGSRTVNNVAFASPSQLRREIEGLLRSGDDPLLSLRDGGEVSALHVVVAYDVYTDPADPGAYYIEVFDSNKPYRDAPTQPRDGSGAPAVRPDGSRVLEDDSAPDGVEHQQRAEKARIHVRNDGTWNMASSGSGTGYGGRSVDTIVPSGFGNPPADPTMISAAGAVKTGFTLLFGWAATGLLHARADAPVEETPPAAVTQISSGGRHLYTDSGEINKDPATALRGTPWAPSTGAEDAASEGFILAAGPGASYTVEVAGERDAPQTRTVLGDNMVAQVTTDAKAGVTDAFTITPRNDAVAYDPGKDGADLNVQMMVRDDGQTRTAEIDTTTTGKDEVSYDDGNVVVDHKGPPAKLDLTLSTASKAALPVAVSTKLKVGRNAKTTLTPASWKKLGKGKLKVRSGGRTRKVRLRRKRAAGATLRSLSVKNGTARAKVRVPASVVAGTARVSFIVRRGRKVVASGSKGVKRSGTVAFKLPKKARRGDKLLAVATTLVARGTTFNSATSKKQVRIRK